MRCEITAAPEGLRYRCPSVDIVAQPFRAACPGARPHRLPHLGRRRRAAAFSSRRRRCSTTSSTTTRSRRSAVRASSIRGSRWRTGARRSRTIPSSRARATSRRLAGCSAGWRRRAKRGSRAARTDQGARTSSKAVEALFGDGDDTARQSAYVAAMERMHARYPDDDEVASFYVARAARRRDPSDLRAETARRRGTPACSAGRERHAAARGRDSAAGPRPQPRASRRGALPAPQL